jgi:hypothetical protein
LNSTFEYTIQFYNPYNYSLDINEIYTSDENLIIELLSNKNIKNKITKNFEHHEQWHVKPYEIKPVIKLNYFAYKLNQLQGFVCIKTNFTDLIILPVEINVLDRPGLYSNVDLLEFTTHRFIRSVVQSIIVPIYVFNNGLDPVMITVSLYFFVYQDEHLKIIDSRDQRWNRYQYESVCCDLLRLVQILLKDAFIRISSKLVAMDNYYQLIIS